MIVEAQDYLGSIKHDVSVSISRVAEFVVRHRGGNRAAAGDPADGLRPCRQRQHSPQLDPAGRRRNFAPSRALQEFNDIVHGIVREFRGAIGAEHGVGLLKRDEITHYKSRVEIELMNTIKRALDPDNIMNPGKVVSV